jgi:DNA-binding MurR/RpiR family transcriptional regulator
VGRAAEILQMAGDLGATTAVVTDRSATELTDAVDIVLPLAGGLREEFSPLVACIPGELLATHLAQASGREAFSFDSRQQFVLNMKGIKGSRIVEFRPE